MKVKSVVSIFSAALLSVGLAYAMPPKPSKCPAGSDIHPAAFDLVQQDKDGSWAAGVLNNKYGTKDGWTFVIGKIQASSEKDARTKALDAVKTLKLQQGPLAIEQYDLWACVYSNSKNYPAVTVNPPMGFNKAKELAK